jgi:hypothetical protein
MLRGFSQTCTTFIATSRFPEWATVSSEGPAEGRSGCSTSSGRGSKTGLRRDKPPSRSQTCREIYKTASCAHIRKRPSLTRAVELPTKHGVGRAVVRFPLLIDESSAAPCNSCWPEARPGDKCMAMNPYRGI